MRFVVLLYVKCKRLHKIILSKNLAVLLEFRNFVAENCILEMVVTKTYPNQAVRLNSAALRVVGGVNRVTLK